MNSEKLNTIRDELNLKDLIKIFPVGEPANYMQSLMLTVNLKKFLESKGVKVNDIFFWGGNYEVLIIRIDDSFLIEYDHERVCLTWSYSYDAIKKILRDCKSVYETGSVIHAKLGQKCI